MTRLIFLDIDGVLNNFSTFCKFENLTSLEDLTGYVKQRIIQEHGPSAVLEPALVDRLNRIIEETGSGVVISSSWRIHYTPAFLQVLLEEKGF
jgi:hypothetical protein